MLHLNLDIVKVYMVVKPNNLLFLRDFVILSNAGNIAKQIGNVILQQAHALAVIEVKVDLPRLLLSPPQRSYFCKKSAVIVKMIIWKKKN